MAMATLQALDQVTCATGARSAISTRSTSYASAHIQHRGWFEQATCTCTMTTDLGLLRLNDDSLADVLRVALQLKILTPLASACRRLCDVARSRVAETSTINSAADAVAFIAHGPAFTACTTLSVSVQDDAILSMLPEVLEAAANLDHLNLLVIKMDMTHVSLAANTQLEDIDGVISTGLRTLPALQQLQRLWLTSPVVGASTAAYVGSLQQLSELHLYQGGSLKGRPGFRRYRGHPQDLSSLSGLVNLKELYVVSDVSTAPLPPEHAGSCCLPSSLQILLLEDKSVPYWLKHLAGSPRLIELIVQNSDNQHASAHPAAILQQVARSAPWLRQITFTSWYHNRRGPRYDLQLPLLQDVPVPATNCLHEALPAPCALEYLDVGGCLSVKSALDWEALGSLGALTGIHKIDVFCAPAQQWQHLGVEEVVVALVGLSSKDAAQVLLGFPAAKRAEVRVFVQQGRRLLSAAASTGHSGVTAQGASRELSCLTSLDLSYAGVGAADSPEAHVAPMLAAASGVVNLKVTWSSPYVVAGNLPDLSCVTAVTQLELSGPDRACEEDVYGMLQPLAATLRVLKLATFRRISPRAAVVLHERLPHLQHVDFKDCAWMDTKISSITNKERFQHLQQLLSPGLTVTAFWHNMFC